MKAQGLVIFSMSRIGGFLLGQCVGNGVIVARLHDGSWSPPAAIETLSLAFVNLPIAFGIDLVEVVMVLPTAHTLDSFKDAFRLSLGFDTGVSLGPWGGGVGAELASNKAIYNKMPRVYTRSRGLFIGSSLDVRYVGSCKAADELFYGKKGLTTNQILSGNVPEAGPKGMWYVVRRLQV
jgi:SH3 domain-containing YSC84-like protein 1